MTRPGGERGRIWSHDDDTPDAVASSLLDVLDIVDRWLGDG